jgi:hypothetical protein
MGKGQWAMGKEIIHNSSSPNPKFPILRLRSVQVPNAQFPIPSSEIITQYPSGTHEKTIASDANYGHFP